MSNIFNLTHEEKTRNTKLNAIKKYGKEAYKLRTCEICKKEYTTLTSNCMYALCFCSSKCEKVRDKILK